MVIEKAVCQGCFFCTAYIGEWDVIDLIIIIIFVRDNALHDFRRAPRCGQAAQNLRADRNHLMPPRKITDRLIVIVSAAVFAVFAQQAGADQNLHCCALRFSDTESFTYSTTLLGIEKEDFAFPIPIPGGSP